MILDPCTVRRRRADQVALLRLEAAAAGDWAAATLGLLRERGGEGAQPRALVPRLGHAAARLRGWAVAGGAREVADGTLLHPAAWTTMLDHLRATLAGFHAAQPMAAGMRPDALRGSLPADVSDAVAAALLAAGGFERDHGLLRLPGFDPARAMAAEGRDLALGLAALFRQAGLSPPDAAEVAAGDRQRVEALRFLLQKGVLVRTVDAVQHRTILFHRDAVAEAQRRLAETLARPEGFTAGEAGALLGISRKFSIPLLEHLDALRFTRRAGDRRFLEGDATVRRSAAEMAR
ncbi:SelB C-terminal domain-containing protein [Dankookia sp. P2]|uniref:SelB domain-containing protein n=1 Tax=Dankookia sp. P2 TaxID=3423955 RepID=UPI003D667334